MTLTRRSFLATASIAGLGSSVSLPAQASSAQSTAVPQSFPSLDPAVSREMVGVSHGNVARVRELVSARPDLAKASWDWGFGDWETALGAASHVGNREIAELLIAAGAPATIFSAAMLGQLATVRAFITASPGVQRVKGPHGISLLSHARAGQAVDVIDYLQSLGDADPQYRNADLSDADRTAILGTYDYGPGGTERLNVLVNPRGSLMIQREGGVERNLLHQGDRVFHPSGAEAVRIRFAAGVNSAQLRIEDGPLVVVASRVP